MKARDFERLKESVREMAAVKEGEARPHRSHVYEGKVLVAVKEGGETVWQLSEAARLLPEAIEGKTFRSYAEMIKTIRTSLNQTQAGFAELLGIPLGTLQGWEQGRRVPDESALQLIRIAALHPNLVHKSATNPDLRLELGPA
ncbi:helix-turn-helix domain-containing protein [Rhodocaloribacter sp.]